MFILDYLPPSGPGQQPLRPFERLPRRRVQRDGQGAGGGGVGRVALLPRVAMCARHRGPPCAACVQRGAEHWCQRAHEGQRMGAAQAPVAARALRPWLQPAQLAGTGSAVASQAARGSPSARKCPRSQSPSPAHARDTTSALGKARVHATPGGALSPPPPLVSMGGGHSLSVSGMLNERGGLRRPFPSSPPPPPPGGASGERLQASRAPAGRPDRHTHMGGVSTPPSRGLADIFGGISCRLTAARAGTSAGHRPGGGGGGAGAGDVGRPPSLGWWHGRGNGGGIPHTRGAGQPPPRGRAGAWGMAIGGQGWRQLLRSGMPIPP